MSLIDDNVWNKAGIFTCQVKLLNRLSHDPKSLDSAAIGVIKMILWKSAWYAIYCIIVKKA